MKKIMNITLFAAISLALTGCVTTKTLWTSTPVSQTAENKYYEATITPIKSDNKFYVSFRLDVVNKHSENLEIDWNRTKYIQNGHTNGTFVFKGINPEDIKKSTVPNEIIPGASKFEKVISPYKMVAYAPIRANVKGNRIMPGILPDGENGVHLVVRQGDKEITEKLTVVIGEIKE